MLFVRCAAMARSVLKQLFGSRLQVGALLVCWPLGQAVGWGTLDTVCEGLSPYYDSQDLMCAPSLCVGFCAAASVLVGESRYDVAQQGFAFARVGGRVTAAVEVDVRVRLPVLLQSV